MSNGKQGAAFCEAKLRKDEQMNGLRANDDAKRTKAGILNTLKKYTLQYGNSKRFFG